MIKFSGPAQDGAGNSLVGYSVRVLDASGGQVDIFSDASGTNFQPTANVVTVDDDGMVFFWWTPAEGQTYQLLNPEGLIETQIADFASNEVAVRFGANQKTRLWSDDDNIGSSGLFIQTGNNDPAKAGTEFASAADFFVYDAAGNQHRYNETIFDAAKMGVNHTNTGTENRDRMADILQYVSENHSGTDRKTIVRIPNTGGAIDFDDTIEPYSHTSLQIDGHVRFTGSDTIGGFVGARPKVGAGQKCTNVEICGAGVVDSNNVGNDNAIFVSNRDNGDDDATSDIWVHGLRVTGARSGGGTDLDTLGNTGGKGFTAQFGINGLIVNDMIFDDCDIGMSVEGKATGNVRSIIFDSNIVRNSTFMGLLLGGDYSAADYGQMTELIATNMLFENCTNGTSADGDYVGELAEFMGVITSKVFAYLDIQAKIRNLSGRTTLMRGSFRNSNIDIHAVAENYHDFVNPDEADINGAVFSGSLYNDYNIRATLRDGTHHGHMIADTDGTKIDKSTFDIKALDFGGGTPAAWDTTKYVDTLGPKVSGVIHDRLSDDIAKYDKGEQLGVNTSSVDDSVLSRTLRNESGTAVVKLFAGATFYGVTVYFDKNGGTPKITLSTVTTGGTASNIEVGTGILTGTDGSDNKATISISGDVLYVENRLGATYDLQIEEL